MTLPSLPQPGDLVRVDYPGYVHHGVTVRVVAVGVPSDTSVRQYYSGTGSPMVTFQHPEVANVQIGLPLHRVRRVPAGTVASDQQKLF